MLYRFWYRVIRKVTQKEQRKLVNEGILWKHKPGHVLFHYFPFTWRKSQRPYHGLEDSLKLLRAPPPTRWPQLLFTLFPHWLLAFPCKHQALTSGPLYLLTLCQEKSPWQLHSSPCTLFRSLLKCHHSRAFPDIVKEQPFPNTISQTYHLTFFLFYLSIHSCMHSLIVCLLSPGCRHFVGFTTVSPVHRIVPGTQ